ncbi:MAG: hypothetical protein OEM94_06275 [Acidimicrobiia bacterium]|nr:hypothetical protein [Acidimicrobiia bacterium]
MNWIHPSRRKLERWTAHPGPGRVEKHLSSCERCSNRLGVPDNSVTVGELLAAFVAPPQGLEGQLVEELAKRERESRDTLSFVIDLFGVWWDTGRVVFGPGTGDQVRDDG